MTTWLIGEHEYTHVKNKNNTYSLIDDEGTVLLIFDTDYRVYEHPGMDRIGHIHYEGNYLVFIPLQGKVIRPYRLEVNPDNIIQFHLEVARWWLQGRT